MLTYHDIQDYLPKLYKCISFVTYTEYYKTSKFADAKKKHALFLEMYVYPLFFQVPNN